MTNTANCIDRDTIDAGGSTCLEYRSITIDKKRRGLLLGLPWAPVVALTAPG